MKLLGIFWVLSSLGELLAAEDTLGYGTKFGTDLKSKEHKNGVVGLGSGPALLPWAVEEDVLGVYHRYQLYRQLLDEGVSKDSSCRDGCPEGTHCSFGFCYCDPGKLTYIMMF